MASKKTAPTREKDIDEEAAERRNRRLGENARMFNLLTVFLVENFPRLRSAVLLVEVDQADDLPALPLVQMRIYDKEGFEADRQELWRKEVKAARRKVVAQEQADEE